jgi:hypothetical protein
MQFASCRYLFTDILLLFCLNVNAQKADDIVGKWQNIDDRNFQIEISISNEGKYFGRVINSLDHTVNGREVLKKFVYNKERKKYFGTLSPLNMPLELVAEIKMVSVGELKITMHKFLLTKTIYLIRI